MKLKNILTRRASCLLIVFVCSSCSTGAKNSKFPTENSSAQKKWEAAQEQYALSQNATSSIQKVTRAKGEIAPGYLIAISTDRDPALNGKFRVEFDGSLELPYEKKIATEGLTIGALSSKINGLYKDFFTSSPNIRVNVAEESFYVEVLGLVEKPGQYLASENESLDSLISKAGGLQKAGGTGPARPTLARFVNMSQLGNSSMLSLSDYYAGKQSDFTWVGGERLFFQSDRGKGDLEALVPQNQIQLLGEVREPGEYSYQPGADFFYYLIKAKGPTDRANMDWVTILRPDGVQMASVTFSLEEDEEHPSIMGGDTVILHAENPTAAQKKLSGTGVIGNIFSTLASVALLFVAI